MVDGLAYRIAKKSFKTLMKANQKILTGPKVLRYKKIKSLEIKRRATFAMLDLCQAMDPTLAKFTDEKPHKRSLFDKWKRYCVAPKSRLCKPLLSSPDRNEILNIARYREYFYSLCTGKQPAE